MKKVSAVEEVMYKIFTDLDAKREMPVYESLRRAARQMKIPDEQGLPPEAYAAAAAFVAIELKKIVADGVEMLEKMFNAVEQSGDEKLKALADEARAPHMFFAAITAQALKDMNVDDLAEHLITHGEERAKKATKATETKAS